MPANGLGVMPRLRYLANRARRIDVGSVFTRAREVRDQHGKAVPVVLVDMLWSAAFKNVGFQDYVDFDFAVLNAAERATYMTHPVSNQLSQRYDAEPYRHIFHDKLEFNRVFDEFLRRAWIELTDDNADKLEEFIRRHGTIIAKTRMGQAGSGVKRYHAAEVTDWAEFHRELFARGEVVIEQVITQHADLAAVCPGTVNTTRVTAFFDGEKTSILAVAQKFGRGEVSDQMSFGGFYTMLDESGHALSAGYDSHGHVHADHPDSGFHIADFQLPLYDEMVAFIDRVARVVPQIQYVGWDVVIGPDGPVLVEGNWGAGVYENKPSVSGIRTGNKPRYRAAIGF
ncbi:sugar-transfer associated ATP-grasp domain-containing protein [Microbacterium abyssi]|uniref:sugar-transfer associated ATP-grasp domain-containing protein n=1 Tax=Microbacterium abyssi TaxID=2782166 RepID=UPI0018880F98|nr:sugar-transfer associated ATP-grasp domain-containing protein [Microbacterium sp. A18JL241]